MSTCNEGNEYNGLMGARISSIFVILVGSSLGAWFPIFTRRRLGGKKNKIFDTLFFAAKFFGSGVIVATAFIHLLAPAVEALGDECLTGPITEYSWPEGIALMTIFVLFFAELMTMRYGNFGQDQEYPDQPYLSNTAKTSDDAELDSKIGETGASSHVRAPSRGEDHFGHKRDHDPAVDQASKEMSARTYAAQMTGIFILEFGIIFHSIFIGLTLAVSGEEFKTLYIVLVFHQTFEGLGLGTRLAAAPWPRSKRWTPYLMALAYGLTTPIAIAIGLGVRQSFQPGSQTTLIVNGVFDSVSAGILIFTGLVELMAHEFMFSPTMMKAPLKTLLSAFLLMCLGAGLMALLGKWA